MNAQNQQKFGKNQEMKHQLMINFGLIVDRINEMFNCRPILVHNDKELNEFICRKSIEKDCTIFLGNIQSYTVTQPDIKSLIKSNGSLCHFTD